MTLGEAGVGCGEEAVLGLTEGADRECVCVRGAGDEVLAIAPAVFGGWLLLGRSRATGTSSEDRSNAAEATLAAILPSSLPVIPALVDALALVPLLVLGGGFSVFLKAPVFCPGLALSLSPASPMKDRE